MAKPKRPRDTNQLAKFVVGMATGEISEPDPSEGKDRKKVASGSLGGKAALAARTIFDNRKTAGTCESGGYCPLAKEARLMYLALCSMAFQAIRPLSVRA